MTQAICTFVKLRLPFVFLAGGERNEGAAERPLGHAQAPEEDGAAPVPAGEHAGQRQPPQPSRAPSAAPDGLSRRERRAQLGGVVDGGIGARAAARIRGQQRPLGPTNERGILLEGSRGESGRRQNEAR